MTVKPFVILQKKSVSSAFLLNFQFVEESYKEMYQINVALVSIQLKILQTLNFYNIFYM